MIKANEEGKGMEECYTTMCGASMISYPIKVIFSPEFKVTDEQNQLGIDFLPMSYILVDADTDKTYRKPVAAIYNLFMCVQQRL